MKKIIGGVIVLGVLAAIAVPVVTAFLGVRVEVPPAHLGKVLTKNGYKPDTVPPSKFRLDACWAYCDRLVLVEASDQGMKEEFRLFMPQDQLNMAFDVRFTMSIRQETGSVDGVFDRIPPDAYYDNGTSVITAAKVYEVYGQPAMREVVRAAMANYSINEVASSRERVNQELTVDVLKALADTPLSIKRFSIADVQFPDVITRQKEVAAQRRIEIEEQEAKKQIELVRLQTELEKARLNRQVRRERAEAAREENQIFAASVTDEYLAYKRLEVLQALAESGASVFVPYEALDSLGLTQRVFNGPEATKSTWSRAPADDDAGGTQQ